MKVVLINPPQNTKYPQPPMGLALLGAILEREKHEVKIVDLNIVPDYQPYLYGADVSRNNSHDSDNYLGFRYSASVKRYNKNIRVILGGVHATLLPDETHKACPEIDCIVVGEGDQVLF